MSKTSRSRRPTQKNRNTNRNSNKINHITNARSFQRLIVSHVPKKTKRRRNKKSQLSYPLTIRTFTNRMR